MGGVKLNEAQSAYLDFVRAMAAMAVLIGHASKFFLDGGVLKGSGIEVAGVLIFFLLSGFLISYSVFRKHADESYRFREYFIDRFFRIFVAFIPALVFVWLVDMQSRALPVNVSAERLVELPYITFLETKASLQAWIGNLLMLQEFPVFQVVRKLGVPDNAWFVSTYGSAAPFWTVSIEWWIYMVFGFVTLVLMRLKKGKLRLWHLAVLGFVAVEPLYYLIGGTDNCLTLLWIMGMGACLLFLNLPKWLNARMALAFFVGGMVLMAGRLVSLKIDQGHFAFAELQFSLFMAMALFGLLFALAKAKVPVVFRRVSKVVADYSYSLYLTHTTVLTYMYLRFPGNDHDLAFFGLAILAANAVAFVFWLLFERHYSALAKWAKARQ